MRLLRFVALTVTIVSDAFRRRVWDDDWETPRDIPRINALRSTSERPSIPAVRPALRNHHPPSVAKRRCGFRWVPVRCLVQVEPAEYWRRVHPRQNRRIHLHEKIQSG